MNTKRPTTAFCLLIMFVISLATGGRTNLAGQSPTDVHLTEGQSAGSTRNEAAWLEKIIALANEHHGSYQVLLWKVFHVLDQSLYIDPHANRSWGLAEANMARLGLTYTFGNEAGDPKYCRCVIKKGVCLDQAKHSYDLCLDFLINVKPKEIYSVYPYLVCQVNQPLETVIEHNGFQEHLAIERLLTLAEVKKQAVKFPLLKSIEITYTSLKDHRYAFGYNGFLIDLELDGDHTGEKITYAVASGLDPSISPDAQGKYVSDASPSKDVLIRDNVRGIPKSDEEGRPGVFWDAGNETWRSR